MSPPLPGLSPKRIHIALLERGITQQDIATAAGRSRQLVNAVICRRQRGLRMRRLIATVLDMPYSEVWGEDEPTIDTSIPAHAGAGAA